jgi:hypothetical protein
VKKYNLNDAGLLQFVVAPNKGLEMEIANRASGEAAKLEMHTSIAGHGYACPVNICGFERRRGLTGLELFRHWVTFCFCV